ncbi:AMP-dependent synthetase/ligase [Tenacibaculum piscium]|uniref:AMP-dependent synthetase n=1 Tax=Tenacibaculum piscium TaxID=1458515 RepID=A0A2H1YGL9_9FLAO|nr:AMP-dependent synthetase/ligase [Tenacibaculum piscium]MBE7630277.1 AMP-binding protein [Tenacibaculum piscium]MBE7670864.1 AMP-binding protein [Tenacibaculum piscium]MBE7685704.1 AMP-binding protein [Tenacibaculum piscium]SOS74662.1 AMP-dependent synthetase [Tenacibaculum piscium]
MSIEITRLFDFPYHLKETYNLDKAFSTKYNGTWESISTQEYIDKANTISRGLLRLGVQPNDKIAVISSSNRTEWNICDIGILQTGAQNVPIYPTISKEDYEYVLNHSESTYCIVSDETVLEKLNQIKGNTKLKGVFTFDAIANEKSWKEILKLGEDTSNQSQVEARKKKVTSDSLATLIYTSGTTGKPKGVMLSHGNIVTNVLASEKRVPLTYGQERGLSFLPVCHVFERMILYLYQYCGVSIYFAESIEKLSENAQEIKPHVMTAVPRLYEKIYDKIYAKGADLTGIKKKLFFWAIDLGLQYEPYGANGWWYEKQLSIARKLIFSKWQAALGGELKLMVSGSAALQPRLTRLFTAAGMPVMEGYGLTETSPVISVNDLRDDGFRIGTVGKVLDGIDLKFADSGEILVKGANVMLGYYKDPEKTAEVIKDGYFYTGDKGELDTDGFLKITGRTKEMFKTSGGKYIIPPLLEGELKESRFIEQVMVIGEGEKMACALIQPNFDFVKEWALRHGIELKSNEELIKNQQVIDRIEKEVALCNTHFGKWETIKKFELTADEWSIEGGHLTPTLKMKRNVIKEIYKDLYEKIYRS